MDFTFARFALNMAMASSRTEPEVMLKAGAPAFLVGMLSNPNELVRWVEMAEVGAGTEVAEVSGGSNSRVLWEGVLTCSTKQRSARRGGW